jgi:hypothetical protein
MFMDCVVFAFVTLSSSSLLLATGLVLGSVWWCLVVFGGQARTDAN